MEINKSSCTSVLLFDEEPDTGTRQPFVLVLGLFFSRTLRINTYSTKVRRLRVGIVLQSQVIVPNLRAPTHSASLALSNSDHGSGAWYLTLRQPTIH